MIDLPTEPPQGIDWKDVRTFWACPNLSSIKIDPTAPVYVRSEAESVIQDDFERIIALANAAGRVRRIWLGEPAMDQIDWFNQTKYYPVRVVYDGEPPPQEPQPYRNTPFAAETDGEPGDMLFRACELMRDGDFKSGLPLYEHRWQSKQGQEQRPQYEMPFWDGKSKGRILIHGEQGAGDMFHFCRFLKHWSEEIEAVFGVPSDMVEVMSTLEWSGKIVDNLNTFEPDYHIPLCSVPIALGLDMTEVYKPYLCEVHGTGNIRSVADASHVDAERVPNRETCEQAILNLLNGVADSAAPSVGICWGGSQMHYLNALRTITLEKVIAACPHGAKLYSLQKGVYAEQLKHLPPEIEVIDLTKSLKTWADTAALIANLDMVVTIDTGVAHLAGAMGKPVKLLLAGSMDWRWPREESSTYLYPSVELVR